MRSAICDMQYAIRSFNVRTLPRSDSHMHDRISNQGSLPHACCPKIRKRAKPDRQTASQSVSRSITDHKAFPESLSGIPISIGKPRSFFEEVEL